MAKHRGKRKRKKSQASWRFPNRNRHHIKPRCRQGGDEPKNILLLKISRHRAWHALFGNKTIEEAISLLLRVHRAKGRCTGLLAHCLLETEHDNRWERGYSNTLALSYRMRGIRRRRDAPIHQRGSRTGAVQTVRVM